ncbi:hypothetical protein SDC9_96063 [bioreactor metagenome]|uniref:D-glycero-alpha-D-manno-heptose 7-phosphate kinase n=1 Tax=bioreactor metagenome TaxID=1076179 RepID=A0A645AI59_9ZZZZ
MLSNLEVQNLALPSGIVLDAIALLDGRHVARIYGIDDNPKASVNGSFLGATLYDFLAMCKCPAESVWRSAPYTLWNAELYPLCDSHEQALDEALRIYRIASGSASSEDIDRWKRADKTSLMASAGNADTLVMLSRQTELACRIRVERCVFLLEHSASAQEALRELHGSARERAQLEEYARTCGFPLTMRIFSLLALLSEQRRYPDLLDNGYEDESFAAVSREIIRQVSEEFPPEEARFVSDAAQVLLPLRINFCGSPSDAAPYCLEHGGTMLNAAILLNGRRPVRARVERLGEPVVLLESIDQNLHRRFDSLEELLHCSDVHDPFSLHKSTLIVTGLLHRREDEVGLQDILRRLGGGIRLSTATDDVPKGSGLGTSSIIAAACVRALHQAFGLSAQDEKVYAQVFAAEQLMSTGGGWQDQAGGLTGGFKYISSQPGIRQRLKLEPLALSVATREELQQRFALIFSGQRRLARNVLRQEMARCIRCEPDTLEHMQSIRKLCALMKYELERGAVTEFASLLTQQFELVKRIDAGASNTYIEYIFDLCSHLIDGKSVCGAGGGGFLQVILKKGVTHDMLRRHISDNFSNCSISVWNSSFLWELD